MDSEYAKLVGATASQGKSAMPGPAEVGAKIWEHLKDPFFAGAPMTRAWAFGCILDCPGGGGLPHRGRDCDPGRLPHWHVAVDEPGARSIRSGAQANLAARLDAAGALHHRGLGAFPHLRHLHLLALANADQHRVWRRRGPARMAQCRPPLEVGVLRRAFTIILPAAAPTILTGMRISIGIAWLVIVAAEMLVGGTGIGYSCGTSGITSPSAM